MRCNLRHCWFVWLPVASALFGVVGAGCSATYDDTARASRDPEVRERADSPDATDGTGLSPGAALRQDWPYIRSVAEKERLSLSKSAKKGKELVNGHGCLRCHKIDGQGGSIGPDLSAEGDKGRSRDWLATQIRNPRAHNPQTIMPAFGALPDAKINNLVDYLLSLSAREA